MQNGIYVVDSIDNSLAKLLFNNDETVEEIVSTDQFSHPIKEGDVINIEFENGKLLSYFLEGETYNRREQAKDLLEKLRNKNK